MKEKDNTNSALVHAVLAANAQAEKKAEDIVVLDVRGLCNFAEYFVIGTGLSSVQFRAISDSIQEKLRGHGVKKPFHIDGLNSPNWLILDYGDVIVHVFSPESRAYYELERLWGDGTFIDWESELENLAS